MTTLRDLHRKWLKDPVYRKAHSAQAARAVVRNVTLSAQAVRAVVRV